MWGLVRKLCASVPILCRGRGRAFCSSSSSYQTAPLLMIHTKNLFTSYRNGRLKDSSYPYCLFSLADMAGTKEKRVLLPEDKLSPLEKHEFFPDDLRLVGSSHGWVGCVNPRDMKLFLFDPLSPSDSVTLLPPLPDHDSVSHSKLIMSAPPSDPSCRVLAQPRCCLDDICVWKPGDTSWTPLPPHPTTQYECELAEYTVLYSNYRRCFYVFYRTLSHGCILDAWDLSGSPARTTLVIGDVMSSPGAEFGYHLAESPSGDLFLVVKELFGGKLTDEFESSFRTGYPNYLGLRPEHLEHEFYVFKLDLEHPNCCCGQAGDDLRQSFLGGDALFLGKNDSFWVSGRDSPVEPNSIYFTESDYSSYSQFDAFDPARHGGCDMLIFRCGCGTTNRFYFRDTGKKSTDFTPIWVMPRPQSSSMTSLAERFVATPEYKPPS